MVWWRVRHTLSMGKAGATLTVRKVRQKRPVVCRIRAAR
jgi:hypothetical protein